MVKSSVMEWKMKRVLSITMVVLMGCGLLSATPPTCVAGTLASYIALGAGGCTSAGVTFANFSYTAAAGGGAPTIRANQITVKPLFIVPEAMRFNFQAPWSVGERQSQDSIITYTAVLPCGDTRTAEADLNLGAAQFGGIIGSVIVNETTNVGKLSVFVRCLENCQSKESDQHEFNPVSVVLITDHVSLLGGNGGARMNEFSAGMNRCIPCV
jgi:hypothetical protein